MKYIELTLVFILCGLSCLAQDYTSYVVTLVVPHEAKKLTKDKFLDLIHEKFKHYNRALEKEDGLYKNTYSIDDMLVSFYDLNDYSDDKITLEKKRKQMLGFTQLDKSIIINYSEIITVNNIDFSYPNFSGKMKPL